MKINKTKLLLATIAATCMFVGGCNGSSQSQVDDSDAIDNLAPTINGVPFSAEIILGESYNALKSVTAIDDIDGDLTDQITVEVLPYTEVVNGVFTPANAGTYEVGYSVSDSAGNVATEYTDLTVKPGYKDKEIVKTIDFVKEDNVSIVLPETNGSYLLNSSGYQITIATAAEKKEDISFSSWITPMADREYTISYTLTSNKAGVIYLGEEEFALVEGENTITSADKYTIGDLAEGKTSLAFDLYLGSLASGTILTIHRLDALEKSDEVGYDNVIENFDFSAEGAVSNKHHNNAEGTLTATETSATLNVTKKGNDNGVWESQLFLDTGVSLTPGSYEYSLKVKSIYGYQQFEIVYYNGDIEKGYHNANGSDALYGQSVEKGVEKEFTDTILVENAGNNLKLVFQVGHLDDGLTANDFSISEFTLKKQKGEATIRQSFDNKIDGISEYHSEGAEGSTYLSNGNYVYDMTKIGAVDWHNKIVVDLGVFHMLQRYSVGVSVSATKDMQFAAFINAVGGDWAPIASMTLMATSELKELVLSMDSYLDAGFDGESYELLLQFGSETNAGLVDNKLTFSQITVYSEEYAK